MAYPDEKHNAKVRAIRIAYISKSDLMALEVSVLNASNALDVSNTSMRSAQMALASYLPCDTPRLDTLKIPDCVAMETLDPQEVVALALENSDEIADIQQKIVEARRNAEYTRIQSRINANVDIKVGYLIGNRMFISKD